MLPLHRTSAARQAAILREVLWAHSSIAAGMNEKGSSEAHAKLVRDIQLACSNGDTRLWVNINGLFYRENGIPVKVGLFVGCGDLIGFKCETFNRALVARLIMIEAKTGKATATPEQRNAIKMINRMGGYAGIARSVEDAKLIISGEYNL